MQGFEMNETELLLASAIAAIFRTHPDPGLLGCMWQAHIDQLELMLQAPEHTKNARLRIALAQAQAWLAEIPASPDSTR
ncbi:hypothetical protein [Paraburkholderia hospita]|uniref:hypothetical protein n=1 Tax=Paraburkholderia hospita TaxID=169430 RepID=UPI001F3B285E|nr:hypothetical protein [Paraburkholderia hospita]